MGFQSVNELEQFAFDDCEIVNMELAPGEIRMELEALIVRRNNSQNTNFTESYAGTTHARFVGGRIQNAFKDGYKYYDANEVLKKEVPDKELDKGEIDELIKKAGGAYLYFAEKEKEENGELFYSFGVEFVDRDENTMSDSYTLHLAFEKAIFNWEHYMNRVQR